jgi:hypothetical protein
MTMVYLIADARARGVAEHREVRTPYETLAEAQAQAEHDLMQGLGPLRIVQGETGELLWQAPAAS